MTNIHNQDKYLNTNRARTSGSGLGNYLLKLRRRWKPALAVFILTVGITGALSTLLQKSYRSEAKLLFKPNPVDNLNLDSDENKFRSLVKDNSPLRTEIERITSDPVLQQTIDQLKLVDENNSPLTPQALEQQLSVEIVGGSRVVKLAYKDSDPYTSAKVINTLMDIYLQHHVSSNRAETENAGTFINNQIPQVETQLQSASDKLEGFYTKNQIIDLKEEKKVILRNLGDLNRQISTTGASLQGKQAQTSSLQSQLGLNLKQAIAANQLSNSPSVQGILSQMETTEKELAQERQRFKDDHPTIASLQEKKTYLKQGLEDIIRQYVGTNVSDGLLKSNSGLRESQLEKYIALKIDELSLQKQLASLYQFQESQLARAKQLPKLERQEQELLREVNNAQETYDTLRSNQEDLTLILNQQTSNAEVIETARVPEEGSTGIITLMVSGVILGLLLSNLTAILLEMQDRTLKTIPEIKQKFAYNVLGIIPLDTLPEQSGIIVQREPDSFTSEIYRMIQANLKFLALQSQPQVILMTSSVPNEGKSTVAANLAAAMAQLGRKVLIIDGDLRKASQQDLWQVNNKTGLRDVLLHKTPMKELLTKPMPKLDLLTSGTIGPNPLALLDSPEMNQLVAQARKEYDLVVIDAPPLPVTADVLTLSKLADGLLFVSRPGVVEHESAELAQETLNTINQKVLGMVINGVKPSEFDRYSYHAKYSKNYFKKPLTDNGGGHSKTVTA